MMNKEQKNLPHISTVVSFVVLIVLGLACASAPTLSVELAKEYQRYLLPPSGNERVIDSVGVRGSTSFVCRDGQHQITPAQVLGATYQVRDPNAPKQGLDAILVGHEQQDDDRHKHEPIFGHLLNEAKKQYSSVTVDIRNAKTSSHIPTNARQEEYVENVPNSAGQMQIVRRTRTMWDCFPYYTAEVITTEPMPRPVTHSENFTKPGSTRDDIYRRAINWLEENKQSRSITIPTQNMARGRLQGTVTVSAIADQTYLIVSTYTIDVYDARVEMRFENTKLQTGEEILLQSIANAAQAALIEFSTTLRSAILR